jgi:hypothetical protein
VTIVYVSNRYSLQGDEGAGRVNPFSAGNSVRDNRCNRYITLTLFVILAAATASSSTSSAIAIATATATAFILITSLQKLVEIVRASDKKQRRRRVGSSVQDVAVEMVEMQGGEQAHAADDL